MSQTSDKESKTRSIYKGLTWRCLATATTFLLAWLFAKDLSVATTIATAEFFIKFAIYYLHERAWQRVPSSLGKKRPSIPTSSPFVVKTEGLTQVRGSVQNTST